MIKYLEDNLAWLLKRLKNRNLQSPTPPPPPPHPPLIIGTGFQLCILKKPNAAALLNSNSLLHVYLWQLAMPKWQLQSAQVLVGGIISGKKQRMDQVELC